MKTGEKAAIGIVSALVLGMVVLAITHEVDLTNRATPDVSTNPQRSTSASNLQDVLVIPPGMLPEDLPVPESAGARALALYCVQCHDLPTPAMHSTDGWKAVLSRMRNHMSHRRGGMLVRIIEPPEKSWAILETYLAQHAQKALRENSALDTGTAEYQVFASYCSQCHALPDPAQHTRTEWARTLLRMKSHMQRAHKNIPAADDNERILNFLSVNAADP